MITDLNNNNYICYFQNNITTDLNDKNYLCYLQNNMITKYIYICYFHNNMITNLKITIIFVIFIIISQHI